MAAYIAHFIAALHFAFLCIILFNMASADDLVMLLGSQDPLSSRQIQVQLGASQATVSRLLTRAGDRVVRLGRGRNTLYAASLPVFGTTPSVPLFTEDRGGVVSQVGTLWSLASGQYLVETARDAPFWLRGESGTGLFDSLPYFLFDLCPSGFLGRQVARSLALEWGFPADPHQWQDEHIGQYLTRRGDDLPGNLLVGEAMAQQTRRNTGSGATAKTADYPRLATQALGDEVVGSSAAGEQPKFAVRHHHRGAVIVKFAPKANTAEARRWRDLLHAELHALQVLGEREVPVAESTLHLRERRLFLESRRFDRHGARGRSPSISLTMVDAEFVGLGHGWTRVADALHRGGLLDGTSLERISWAETFGTWIGNTDMHLGNVSLAPGEQGFELLPLYDMLPMAFAPARGELPQIELHPPLRTDLNREVWTAAGEAAVEFWSRLAGDREVSRAFRAVAKRHGRRWRDVLGR